jgi:hypothetical protein
LACVTRALAAARASFEVLSSRLARLSWRLARAWIARTATAPTSATSTAAVAVITAVRLRRAQRRARRDSGSRQAATGSLAIHRSTSSASARHEP